MTFQYSPGGSIIVDMTDSKKVSDYLLVGAKGDLLGDQELGVLIQKQCGDQDSPKQSIGLETGHWKRLLQDSWDN